MKMEVFDFDAARYLKTEEDMREFLSLCAEDPNPAVFLDALSAVARARGMTRLAKDTGLGRESLYKALTPGKRPQFATVVKIMNALGVGFDVRKPKAKRRRAQPAAAKAAH